MGPVSDVEGVRANENAATNGQTNSAPDDSGNILPDLWFALMCRQLWQFKASAHLHLYTRRSDRTCRAWEAGDNEPGATALADLLRSKEGYRVLKFIMRDSGATWWVVLQSSINDIAKFAASDSEPSPPK